MKTVKTVCLRDCPDTCFMDVSVERGKIINTRGNRENQFTGGFLLQAVKLVGVGIMLMLINPKLAVAKKLGELGMMVMAANPGNVIAMAPPLIVTKQEIDQGIALMDQALDVGDGYTEN